MVVGAKGNNPEGEMLAETVDLRFMGYTQAVEKLLASDQVLIKQASHYHPQILSIAITFSFKTNPVTSVMVLSAGNQECMENNL